MEIYHYSKSSGEFIKSSSAAKNPLEEGKFLIPAYATAKKPPAPETDKQAVFNGTSWALLADLRGTEFWLGGNHFIMEAIGALPKGAVTKAPLPTPEQELESEVSWVAEQLNQADIELNKVLDNHARKRGTESNWRQYRNDLRDYIQGGTLEGSRPVAPDA